MLSPQQFETIQWVDTAIRIVGWPTFLGAAVWAVRKWDAGQRDFRSMYANTKLAADTVTQVKSDVEIIKSNHLAHLQTGIDKVAISNDKAVEVLQEIKTGITVLVDRNQRL